jgi:organic hydroperoxide reductase OsmC/OhrA
MEHHYKLRNVWHGNKGTGTSHVAAYDRSHTVAVDNKPELHLTTGNALRGDPSKLNPEDLLLAAVSSCHLLSYLYLCSVEGVVVTEYSDDASGIMDEHPKGGGKFREIVLRPVVQVANSAMIEKAMELHHKAHEICYIANSVNFKVKCEPICR